MTSVDRLPLDAEHVFDLCATHLARDTNDLRHNYFGALPDTHGRYSEGWRFPCVESHFSGDPIASGASNNVTFVFVAPRDADTTFNVGVRGTFAPLYEIIPLERARDSRFFAATLVLPSGQTFRYRYVTRGREELDPVNPQITTEDNGAQWSQFFTLACFEAITFERWERIILDRLTRHILPFNTQDARNFLERLSSQERAAHPYLSRFDIGVGVVNFLDKLLAREERHQLPAYKICLSIIDQLLRQRNPYLEPRDMNEDMFVQLYDQMVSGDVPGWDYERYNNPKYFLQMLRRHTITAALSHPKYGGNAGAAAWSYLSDRYRDADDKTLFDWERAMELPLGHCIEYRG